MIAIRPEIPADTPAIRALLVSAFGGEDEARLVDALRSNGHLPVSLVALEGDRIVGHIAFSPVTLDGMPGGLGLAPLAVDPANQKNGIGGRLMREGLDCARATGAGFVVVLGHPEYYPRFGFRRASELGIGNEYGADEAFMVLKLRTNGIPPGGGMARYGAEFGAWS